MYNGTSFCTYTCSHKLIVVVYAHSYTGAHISILYMCERGQMCVHKYEHACTYIYIYIDMGMYEHMHADKQTDRQTDRHEHVGTYMHTCKNEPQRPTTSNNLLWGSSPAVQLSTGLLGRSRGEANGLTTTTIRGSYTQKRISSNKHSKYNISHCIMSCYTLVPSWQFRVHVHHDCKRFDWRGMDHFFRLPCELPNSCRGHSGISRHIPGCLVTPEKRGYIPERTTTRLLSCPIRPLYIL